jgi:hypothetical protein
MIAIYDWTCGHTSSAVCAECHQQLIRKANGLAAEAERLRELLQGPDPHYDMAREIGELRAEIELLRSRKG